MWTASYTPAARQPAEATGLTAATMLGAACAFTAWRMLRSVDYHAVTFEELAGAGVTVTPLHQHFSPARLAQVLDTMLRVGAPRIRAYFDAVSNAWYALEGTHRLRAAHLLGVAPILVPVRWPRRATALDRARYAAPRRGHVFARIDVNSADPGCPWTTWGDENGVGAVRCGRPTTHRCDHAPDTCERHKSSCCFPHCAEPASPTSTLRCTRSCGHTGWHSNGTVSWGVANPDPERPR